MPLLLLSRARSSCSCRPLSATSPPSPTTSRAARAGRRRASPASSGPCRCTSRYARTPVHETVEELLADRPGAGLHRALLAGRRRWSGRRRCRACASSPASSGMRSPRRSAGSASRRRSARRCPRYVRAGIGVHHAGMLPRYRRLVETLAQRGLLRVICGTDTLGVGINVPIRTVLITALAKYDGQRMRQLSAREFHQVAGRAGRAGLRHRRDRRGDGSRARDRERQRRRQGGRSIPRSSARSCARRRPQGFVNWGEASFERLVDAEPEPLEPHLQLTAAMLINVIARGRRRVRERARRWCSTTTSRGPPVRARPPRARDLPHAGRGGGGRAWTRSARRPSSASPSICSRTSRSTSRCRRSRSPRSSCSTRTTPRMPRAPGTTRSTWSA